MPPMSRSVPKLATLAGALLILLVVCVLGPLVWTRYLDALSHRTAVLYQPREKLDPLRRHSALAQTVEAGGAGRFVGERVSLEQ